MNQTDHPADAPVPQRKRYTLHFRNGLNVEVLASSMVWNPKLGRLDVEDCYPALVLYDVDDLILVLGHDEP